MARKKREKEPVLPALIEEGNHKNRLRVNDPLFCFDGKSLMEEVTVVEVDKKLKIATLSNQVRCSRYPDAEGYYRKEGTDTLKFKIKKWDDDTEALYRAAISKKQITTWIYQIQTNLLKDSIIDMPKENWDKINNIAAALSKIMR